MDRKSFVLYTEWENTFDRLSNEVAGELIKVIFDYVRTGEVPQIDNAVVDGVFSVFQPSIDRNISKYDAAIEQRKEAGKRSAEKRKRNTTTVDESKRNTTTVESRLRSSTDSVSDSVSDIKNSLSHTLSPFVESESENLCERVSERKFTPQKIKQELLSDQSWKESFCISSSLPITFMPSFPDKIDKFLAYIISIGEERSILDLSDAKRRFLYWWRDYGSKEEVKHEQEIYIIPD